MSPEVWVVNASPLIALARVGRLDLLTAPHRSLVIPQAVADEIRAGPPHDPARQALELGFGGNAQRDIAENDVIEWGLGRGESAVLALGRRMNATVVIDDRDARRAAKAMGLSYIGTLGVVMHARASGRIESAAELLRALINQGLRLDNQLVSVALREALGETWEPW